MLLGRMVDRSNRWATLVLSRPFSYSRATYSGFAEDLTRIGGSIDRCKVICGDIQDAEEFGGGASIGGADLTRVTPRALGMLT